MDKLMSALAFAVFVIFVGILAWRVTEIDLVVVCGLTVALLGYDLLTSAWSRKK